MGNRPEDLTRNIEEAKGRINCHPIQPTVGVSAPFSYEFPHSPELSYYSFDQSSASE
jgi:hypothetical protein